MEDEEENDNDRNNNVEKFQVVIPEWTQNAKGLEFP